MMGVLEPLEEEMRVSESISQPNGVAIKVQSLPFLHTSIMMILWKETQERVRRGTCCSLSSSKINKEELKYGERLARVAIAHAIRLPLCDLSVSLRQN